MLASFTLPTALALTLTGCAERGAEEEAVIASLIRMAAEGSREQQEFVRDGQVTFDEYEASFFEYVACLGNAGFGIRGTEYSVSAEQFTGAWSDPVGVDAASAVATDDECYTQHHSAVHGLWVYQHRPSSAERLADAARAARCLTEYGIEVDEPVDEMSVIQALDAAPDDVIAACAPGTQIISSPDGDVIQNP